MIYSFPEIHKKYSHLLNDIFKVEGTVLSSDQKTILIPNSYQWPDNEKPKPIFLTLPFTPINKQFQQITEHSDEFKEMDKLTCKTCGGKK